MKTYQFEIAGTRFRMPMFKQAALQRGDRIALVPEPTNQYDANAIKLMKGDLHIGYVPKTHNQQILAALKERPQEVGCCADAVWANGAWVVVNIKEKEDNERDEAKI